MARQREGWKCKPDPETGIYYVRFRHEGRRPKISTGERDPTVAQERAALIYAEVVSGRWDRNLVVGRPGQAFDEIIAEWLFAIKAKPGAPVGSGSCKPKTWDLYKIHGTHLARFFKTIDRVTGTEDYYKARLTEVVRETCKKEITTLRRIMKWAKKQKYISAVPELDYPPKSSAGTPDKKRKHKRKPVPLDRDEALAIIAELPATSKRARRGNVKHAVRDFYVVLWETGLRPTTVEQIATPTHYRRGIGELKIDEVIDKVYYQRDLDLTPAARHALDRWAKDEGGPVFGVHDLRVPFRAACKAAAKKGKLAEWKSEEATQYDFRHGRTTDLLDSGASMVGVAYLVGHKHITTTNRYTHPERKQGKAALLGEGSGGQKGASGRHSGRIRVGSGGKGAPSDPPKVIH